MPERRTTGGQKEFHYKKEDLDRIRSTDTESTKAFKGALHVWQAERREERWFQNKLKRERVRMTVVLVILLVVLVALLFLRFF